MSNSVIDGPHLKDLRSLLIDTLAVEDVALCGSGSLALEIALRACGVDPGDEIIIPTFCCTAVVSPILAVGALPVLADVGEELNITAETVEAALTEKTKAIIVPHLFGNPADIKTIIDLAHSNHIRVIDDAAQALGATINGQPAGTLHVVDGTICHSVPLPVVAGSCRAPTAGDAVSLRWEGPSWMGLSGRRSGAGEGHGA